MDSALDFGAQRGSSRGSGFADKSQASPRLSDCFYMMDRDESVLVAVGWVHARMIGAWGGEFPRGVYDMRTRA